MFGALLATSLFMTTGYAFAAAVLLILFAVFRKNPHVPGLARYANGALAFYMLCRFLLDIVALLRTRNHFADVASQAVPALLVVLLVWTPYLQKRPLILLIPLGVFANWNNFVLSHESAYTSSDSSTYLAAIWAQEPYLLVLFGVGYCLLTLLLYLVSLWMKRFLSREA